MRRHMVTGLLTALILALFFIGQARAQTQLTWANGELIGSVSQAQINQFNRDLTALNQARKAGPITSATLEAGKVKAVRAATLSFGATAGLGKAAALGLEEFVRYPLSSVGKGLVSVARLTPTSLAGSVAASILLDAGISYLDGAWQKSPPTDPVSLGRAWGPNPTTGPNRGDTPQAACAASYGAAYTQILDYGEQSPNGYGKYYRCAQVGQTSSALPIYPLSTCASGYTLSGGKCVSTSKVPAADIDLEKAISDGITAHPEKASDVLKNIYDRGGWVPLDAADQAGFNIPTPTVEGKPSTTTTTSTAADGSTLTTTKTTTPKATVSSSGDTVSNNYLTYNITNVTTSVTRNEAGNIVSSETTTEDNQDGFQDAAMPALPKLYEQKYPGGIAGVWEASKPDISNTSFYNGIKSMFPSFGGGQCPLWRMSFNLGAAGNFGSGDLTVPCWIFQALGLVILATASFTARKILF